jgi:curved DNA-binding protein CbpA
MPQIKTFYDELGVARNADAGAIKHAFREIAKVYHPDRNPPDKQAWAHEQMSRLNFIFETLLNPATRKEYDDLVKKYEATPIVARPIRRPREQNAIEREYAMVSVEILNLRGKFSNCRLKMAIGSVVGGFASLAQLSSFYTPIGSVWANHPMIWSFMYFFTMIGAVMIIMGVSDYFGRSQYRERIRELEERRSQLRARMYEVYVPN